MLHSLLLLSWLLSPPAASALVLVQPGYPGSTQDAAGFVERLTREIAARGGPKLTDGEYHNDEKAGVSAIARLKPSVAIVSLGFFLEHREHHALKALLWSEPQEPFHLLVRKGSFTKLSDLDGRSVTGTPFLESTFVDRILFGAPELRRPQWEVEPVKLFSRGLRRVQKGRADAVLLTAREYRGLQKLDRAAGFQVLHSTPPVPAAVVVTLEPHLKEEARGDLARALESFPSSDSGRELLEEMGIRRFHAIDPERLAKWVKRYRSGTAEQP